MTFTTIPLLASVVRDETELAAKPFYVNADKMRSVGGKMETIYGQEQASTADPLRDAEFGGRAESGEQLASSLAVILLATDEQTVLGIAFPGVRIPGIGPDIIGPCCARFVAPSQAIDHVEDFDWGVLRRIVSCK